MTTIDDPGSDHLPTPDADAAAPVAADDLAADAGAETSAESGAGAEISPDADGVPKRPSRRRLWISLVAGLLLLAAAVGGYVWAWNVAAEDHARAATALTAAEKRVASVQRGIGSSVVAASVTVKTANAVLAMDIDEYAGEKPLEALTAAVDSAGEEIEVALRPRLKPAATTPEASELFWLWSILGSTASLEERADLDATTTADGKKLIKRLIADDRAVASAGKDTMTAVAASAPTVIGGYASARNTARDALNRSAERLGWTEWPAAETELASYVTAVGELKSSQDAELAEKSGSLLDTRLAAEEYARSIAGGVMLDFDWADIVIGYGWGDSMAGTAEGTWYSPSEVYSTITLTNTVASLWNNGSGWSQALVAHEVGHAIHPKCFDVYPNDAATEEQWATAWSISMGHTGDATGVQAYGYPDDSIIEAAGRCR